jgi:hypothetical protein
VRDVPMLAACDALQLLSEVAPIRGRDSRRWEELCDMTFDVCAVCCVVWHLCDLAVSCRESIAFAAPAEAAQ